MADLLHRTQEKALLKSKINLQKLENIENGYKSLKENLQKLVKKTKHSVMAPICHNMALNQAPIAFMKGTLDHTNEVLVLLGDNWFVERSIYQSLEIIERRIQDCQKRVKAYNDEIMLIQRWLNFSQQISNEKKQFVEIVEEYNEEEEKKWREEHKKRIELKKKEER